MMKKEINIFLTAIMFYTRIPVPSKMSFSNDILHKSTRYLPLIGIIIGGAGAFIFWLLNMILPLQVAIVLSMASTIMLTGAFHEDAFADFCDGFGGGYTRDRILEIMKDSRIGTFGATGLAIILLTKFICISNITVSVIVSVLICSHAFSRFMPVCLIYSSQYVREDESAKSKHPGNKGSWRTFFIAMLFGFIPLILLPWKSVILIVPVLLAEFIIFRWYVTKKIGGYTGDVLGALQQIAEISFYIFFIISKQNFV